MFSMGSFDGGVKCNGHVQLPGRTTKKDRKGCKKEKIETVLKNRLISSPKAKTPVPKLPKNNTKPKHQVIKPVEVEENNAIVNSVPVVNRLNVKDDVTMMTELQSNNTSPTPPPVSIPEGAEERLSITTESSPKKTPAKKRSKNKVEKIGTSVCKKPEKIDPSSVYDKNQLSCNVITIPPKRKYAKMTNWQKDCGTRHETLQRIQRECEKEAKLREDLYPLGKLNSYVIVLLIKYYILPIKCNNNWHFIDLVSSDAEDIGNPLNLELEDASYQRFWLPDDIDSTDRDARVKNLRSVLRRRFHQLSNLPDNSPSPDLVLAMTNAVRHDPVCITKFICPEPSSKAKFKR